MQAMINSTAKGSNFNQFMSKIESIFHQCVGHETYGDVTEFYDEDGVVLMTAREEGENMLLSFGPGQEFPFGFAAG